MEISSVISSERVRVYLYSTGSSKVDTRTDEERRETTLTEISRSKLRWGVCNSSRAGRLGTATHRGEHSRSSRAPQFQNAWRRTGSPGGWSLRSMLVNTPCSRHLLVCSSARLLICSSDKCVMPTTSCSALLARQPGSSRRGVEGLRKTKDKPLSYHSKLNCETSVSGELVRGRGVLSFNINTMLP